MTKRGKVLRDAHLGSGLLMVEGRQYAFVLEAIWKSEAPPAPGMVVEVELDDQGNVAGITAVPEAQLAKEQAEAALAMAKQKGAALGSAMVARFGAPALLATGLLAISWFFLSAVSIRTAFGAPDFTLWQVLGFLNTSNPFELLLQGGRSGSTGVYGVLALVCLAGPFLHHIWKDKRAVLGGILPLLFVASVGLALRSSIASSFSGPGGASQPILDQARAEAMSAISLGLGGYLSLAASLYFAAVSLKKFLAAKAGETQHEVQSRRAAA
jgi:hypothetical protein